MQPADAVFLFQTVRKISNGMENSTDLRLLLQT